MQNKLTNISVRKAGDGKLFDGGGLTLVKKGDRGKWVFRYSHLGKRREMGLGAWPELSLADARKARDAWASVLAGGEDPIQVREAERAAEIAERDKHDPTFAEMVDIVFEAKKDGLRGGGARGRWRSPLDTHVIPRIGSKRMSALTQIEVRDAIKPIWRTKHPTAEKAIQRTRMVFEEARFAGIDCDPFTVDAARRMLGEVRHKTTHIAATPWQDVPTLWKQLDPHLSAGLCLRWMLLTLVRFDGCRAARASEVEDGVWIVPEDRVKGREGKAKDFHVPLPAAAMEIIEDAKEAGDDLLFPGHRGRPVTSRGVEVYLDRIGEPGRPHGFRSAFRSWVQDTDACSFEVAETILGHTIGSTVERSYARSDLLDRRRPVMEAWARFVTGEESASVIPLRKQ
ncbi:MAG: integrase arm-type DNA-binding domain-containing protein [Rhodobacteraceae bacterium]|nr:integrase arm-type DNA-binding domain-containing protein [Paracoccaceae bacterium]